MSEKVFEAFGKRWRVVWQEDEMSRRDPDAEHVDEAWKRLFGTDYPSIRPGIAEEDWGDTCAYLVSGKVVMSSYDGHSIAEEVVEAGGEKRAIAPTPPAPPSTKPRRVVPSLPRVVEFVVEGAGGGHVSCSVRVSAVDAVLAIEVDCSQRYPKTLLILNGGNTVRCLEPKAQVLKKLGHPWTPATSPNDKASR